MASKLVIDAVEARLAAGYSRTPVFGFNAEGDTPKDGSEFLTVQYPVSDERQITVGAPGAQRFREEGGFRLVLSAKRGASLSTALTWIDELRTLFRAKQFGGINTLEASPPFEDDSNGRGNYVLLSIAVAYYADIIA